MLSRILIVAALAVPMFATISFGRGRNDGYYGRDDDYYRRDDDYRRGLSKWRGLFERVINRTLRDLQSAASRNRVDGHERNHFSRAMSELQQIRYRSQQGRIDTARSKRCSKTSIIFREPIRSILGTGRSLRATGRRSEYSATTAGTTDTAATAIAAVAAMVMLA